MMEMFRQELTLAIDSRSQPPITVADFLEHPMLAEYHLVQVKEKRDLYFKAHKEEKTQSRGLDNNKKSSQQTQDQPPQNNQISRVQYLDNGNGKKWSHHESDGNANNKVKAEGRAFQYARLVERGTLKKVKGNHVML